MADFRLGSAVRQVRQARGWRQQDLAARSGISQSAISRIELGDVGAQSITRVRAVASALDIRVDLVPRWRGGDLDRLLNHRHSALHESVARTFRDRWPAWVLAPEASFSVYGERGVIDILAWHSGRRALLVIELKTDIVDLNELLGTLDRKVRLARSVGMDRGWDPASVSAWLIVSQGRTSRRRVADHGTMLRSALPANGRTVRKWLRDPVGRVAGLTLWPDTQGATGRHARRPIRRVRTTV